MRKTLIIFGLLAVGVAGCGSSSDSKESELAQDYAVRVQSAQFEFANAFQNATNSLLKSSDPKKDAGALRAAAAAVDKDVKTLRQIAPPAKVTALHRQLIGAMTSYSSQLNKAAHLIAIGNPKAFVQAQRLLRTSSQQIKSKFNSLIARINARLS
jgi:type VI protein secretion system component VasF